MTLSQKPGVPGDGSSPGSSGRPADLDRRQFLRRLAGASVLAVAAGGLGAALYDPKGPAGVAGGKALAGLGDFRVAPPPAGKPRLATGHGADRKAMFDLGDAAGTHHAGHRQAAVGARLRRRGCRNGGLGRPLKGDSVHRTSLSNSALSDPRTTVSFTSSRPAASGSTER